MQKFAINSTPLPVRELARLKREGRLFLPDLQRGFVWDAERIRMLFDSLYRGYPVGSLLLWKPTRDGDDPAISTRPWDLAPPAGPTELGVAEPAIVPPDDAIFVLDGQQRLTSLFKVLFDSREVGRSAREPDLFVSLASDSKWAEQPFLYKSRQIGRPQERDGLIVPASVLFAGVRTGTGNGAESKAVAKAISQWVNPNDDSFYPAMDRASQIRNAILNAEIAAYELDTSSGDDNVIEIFGRLNQQAVRLTPADLAAARLTGQMVDFRSRADTALQSDIPEGFATREGSDRATHGGRADTDLLVRVALCLATGHIKYRDAEKARGGVSELYSKVEPHWSEAVASVSEVADIYRRSGVPNGDWLPYRYLLLVPAVAIGSKQARPDDEWLGWSIAASLWGLYAGSAETKAQSDARLAREGRWNELWESIRNHAKRPETLIPEVEDFHHGVVQSRGLLLTLLVDLIRRDARSFYGTRLAAPQAADLDVHHIFPRVLFSGRGRAPRDVSRIPDRLGNLTVITASDNRSIGAGAPEAYLETLEPDVLTDHCIPGDPALWRLERFPEFCEERERLLAQRVASLLGRFAVP
jgi:hypothetical protein